MRTDGSENTISCRHVDVKRGSAAHDRNKVSFRSFFPVKHACLVGKFQQNAIVVSILVHVLRVFFVFSKSRFHLANFRLPKRHSWSVRYPKFDAKMFSENPTFGTKSLLIAFGTKYGFMSPKKLELTERFLKTFSLKSCKICKFSFQI